MVRRTWVKITVCPVSNSSLTHNQHHPFKNKVWEIIFFVLVVNWNHFEMRFLNLRINFFYLLRTFFPHLGSFFCVVSSFTTFRPNFASGLLQGIFPRPRIGMLSLVTVSPVITAFHSCCLSHHVFDQVNLWPALVGFETAIFWQCSPVTAATQLLFPLRHGPRSVFVLSLKFVYYVWLCFCLYLYMYVAIQHSDSLITSLLSRTLTDTLRGLLHVNAVIKKQ